MKNKIFKYKYLIGGFILVVLLFVVTFAKSGNQSDTFVLKKDQFVKSVQVSGKVVATQDVALGFDTSGVIGYVNKQVGDKVTKGTIIAGLESLDVQASRDKAYANLLSAQAELAKLESSDTSGSDVSTNKAQVVNAIFNAYTQADDAIRNKVDQYFDNPRSGAAEIKYSFHNYFDTKDTININRNDLEKVLNNFETLVSALSVDTYTTDTLTKAKTYILTVKEFLNTVSFAVNSFETSDELSQTSIDKYKSDLATARTNINTTLLDLNTYGDKLRSSLSSIPVQKAKVKAEEANVRSIEAELSKTIITAPFDGVVSRQDAKVGQAVAQNTSLVSLISNGLDIEVYIPEINIPGIALENPATVTLDAYPDASFEAVVTHIDPAETEKDGVANYKIKLSFVASDPRIKPGMTADVTIDTEKRDDVLLLPLKFVFEDGAQKFVYVKTGKTITKRTVTLGEKDGQGNVEILSGLTQDDVVSNTSK